MSKQTTFLNIEVSELTLRELRDDLLHTDFPLELVEHMLLSGLKVSLFCDARTGNWNCSVTERREGSPNKNISMSAWSDAMDKAIEKVAIVLLHANDFEGIWNDAVQDLKGRAGVDADSYEQFLVWKRAQDEQKGT